MKISIHDIEFSYNGTPVLEDITCTIEKGDFITLVGPNGSGKSTLIKCMNGILRPHKGTVLVNDQSLPSPDELAKKMAYVPQSENKKTSLSVFDTVLLGRKPYIHWKPSKHDLIITADILKSLHLGSLAMKEVNKLSGGQQQAVFIARALAQEPSILLLDEPTANLDIKHQIEVLDLLKSLSNQDITIVIALHDINMAIRYAGKIMMLKEGKIFAYGGKETVTEQHIESLYDIKVHIIRDMENIFIVPNGL
ncbi:MAG: ABC transporter ATP-binding protein [Bacteroidales bacterium]|nr:ABC transporter ATP-binding protein [Bacteroidales bacterium]